MRTVNSDQFRQQALAAEDWQREHLDQLQALGFVVKGDEAIHLRTLTCCYVTGKGACGAPAHAEVAYSTDQGPQERIVCQYHQWWLRRTKVAYFRTRVELPSDAPFLGPNDRSLDQ